MGKNIEAINSKENLRDRAKKSLSEKHFEDSEYENKETEILIYDLRVHQIELEMQNNELQRLHRELEESRNKYFDLYNYAPMGYFTLNEKTIVAEVNLTGANLLGIDRNKIINQRFSKFIAPEYQDTFYYHRKHAFETNEKQTCEIKLIKKDGNQFYVQMETIALPQHKKNKIQLQTVIIDISKIKETERKLRITQSSVDRSSDGIFWINEDSKFIYANDAASKLLGYSIDELLNLGVPDIDPNFPSNLWPEHWKNLMENEKIVFESIHKTKYGESILVEISANLLQYDGQNINCAYTRDIRERKKAETKIRHYNDFLSLLNKILRHDISNYLTVTSISLEMLETKDIYLKNKAIKSIGRSVELINRIAEFENILSAQSQQLVIVDPKKILEDLCKAYPEIVININGDCPGIMGDMALRQVFDNIIRNAIIHGKTSKIDINIKEKEEFCEISIADYGPGIPDLIKNKIIGNGFSFSPTDTTGMGLYIVMKLMERYEGKLRIQDNNPHGAVFILEFKRALD
ncbi:MAG TPA: PAS domain S-box protein [Candidatus Methanofastidiosum sp.]|nr:PAS domain S-box protein [Methanofastidiosum sp.]